MADLRQQDMGVQEPHRSRLYSDLSGMYDRVFTRVFASRIETVVSGLGIEPGSRVLEVGVGTGLSLDSYPSHCQVTGIDVSEDMLERARKFHDKDARVEIEEPRVEDYQVLKLHNFYVRYLLPMMVEVQCYEWAEGFGPQSLPEDRPS